VLAPAGYDWTGNATAFPSNADYFSTMEGATQKALADVTTIADAKGSFSRKATSALSMGILPVFHS
jgi:hypothetical protein